VRLDNGDVDAGVERVDCGVFISYDDIWVEGVRVGGNDLDIGLGV
jgi:hypothetical protein